MYKMSKLGGIFGVVVLAFAGYADIVLQAPVGGKTVPLLPQVQKEIMKFTTHAERLRELNSDRESKQSYFSPNARWRKADPVRFSWTCTAGETGPFKLLVSETPDFQAPIIAFSREEKKLYLPRRDANFKIGQTYYWKVIGRNADQQPVESASGSFVTEDLPPRWIGLYGDVYNIRDVGGYPTLDGRRVRQGMLFRGQGLNYNSVTGEIPGRNRLLVVDVDYMLNKLGIRTDLDLRQTRETAGMTVSPLGEKVKFIQRSSPNYVGIFTESGRQVMAENFRVFCDRNNYPIYFHCIAGADRTGSLAFVLNGLLGVPEYYLGLDWEHTFYPDLPDNAANGNPNYWRLYQHFIDGMAQYGQPDDPLSKKIELYLLDCGITPEEIAQFRAIMLE